MTVSRPLPRRGWWLLGLIPLLSLAVGAWHLAHPRPPTITVRQIEAPSLSWTGFSVVVRVDADNPNLLGATLEDATATVRVLGRSLGTARALATPLRLAGRGVTPLRVQVDAGWVDLALAATSARSERRIPWEANVQVRTRVGPVALTLPMAFAGEIDTGPLRDALSVLR